MIRKFLKSAALYPPYLKELHRLPGWERVTFKISIHVFIKALDTIGTKSKISILTWCIPTFPKQNKSLKVFFSIGLESCKRILKEKTSGLKSFNILVRNYLFFQKTIIPQREFIQRSENCLLLSQQ